MTFEQYVKKAQKGDKSAFEYLIKSMQDNLYRFTRSKINNEEDCIDLVQDAIIDAYYSIGKLKDNKRFKSWLYAILSNKIKDYYSSHKNEIPYENEYLENQPYVMDLNETDYILNDLDDEEKQIVLLFYIDGYTSKEISKMLGINMNTIKTKLLRARNKLKNKLEEEKNG